MWLIDEEIKVIAIIIIDLETRDHVYTPVVESLSYLSVNMNIKNKKLDGEIIIRMRII